MTEREQIEKRLACLAGCLNDLRRLARPELIESDVRERRFVEHTLQLAITAALDVAGHIVADERLGEPETNRDLFRLLAQAGWISASLEPKLERMAGFRDMLVYGYVAVDPLMVRDVVEHHIGKLEELSDAVLARLNA